MMNFTNKKNTSNPVIDHNTVMKIKDCTVPPNEIEECKGLAYDFVMACRSATDLKDSTEPLNIANQLIKLIGKSVLKQSEQPTIGSSKNMKESDEIFEKIWTQVSSLISSVSIENEPVEYLNSIKDTLKDSTLKLYNEIQHIEAQYPKFKAEVLDTRSAAAGSQYRDYNREKSSPIHDEELKKSQSQEFRSGPLYGGLRENQAIKEPDHKGYENVAANANTQRAEQPSYENRQEFDNKEQLYDETTREKYDFSGANKTGHVVYDNASLKKTSGSNSNLEQLQFGSIAQQSNDIKTNANKNNNYLSSEDESEALVPEENKRQKSASQLFSSKANKWVNKQSTAADENRKFDAEKEIKDDDDFDLNKAKKQEFKQKMQHEQIRKDNDDDIHEINRQNRQPEQLKNQQQQNKPAQQQQQQQQQKKQQQQQQQQQQKPEQQSEQKKQKDQKDNRYVRNEPLPTGGLKGGAPISSSSPGASIHSKPVDASQQKQTAKSTSANQHYVKASDLENLHNQYNRERNSTIAEDGPSNSRLSSAVSLHNDDTEHFGHSAFQSSSAASMKQQHQSKFSSQKAQNLSPKFPKAVQQQSSKITPEQQKKLLDLQQKQLQQLRNLQEKSTDVNDSQESTSASEDQNLSMNQTMFDSENELFDTDSEWFDVEDQLFNSADLQMGLPTVYGDSLAHRVRNNNTNPALVNKALSKKREDLELLRKLRESRPLEYLDAGVAAREYEFFNIPQFFNAYQEMPLHFKPTCLYRQNARMRKGLEFARRAQFKKTMARIGWVIDQNPKGPFPPLAKHEGLQNGLEDNKGFLQCSEDIGIKCSMTANREIFNPSKTRIANPCDWNMVRTSKSEMARDVAKRLGEDPQKLFSKLQLKNVMCATKGKILTIPTCEKLMRQSADLKDQKYEDNLLKLPLVGCSNYPSQISEECKLLADNKMLADELTELSKKTDKRDKVDYFDNKKDKRMRFYDGGQVYLVRRRKRVEEEEKAPSAPQKEQISPIAKASDTKKRESAPSTRPPSAASTTI